MCVDIENAIDDPPQMEGWASGSTGLSFGLREQGLENIPLLICQIGWIMGVGAHRQNLLKRLKTNRSLTIYAPILKPDFSVLSGF